MPGLDAVKMRTKQVPDTVWVMFYASGALESSNNEESAF